MDVRTLVYALWAVSCILVWGRVVLHEWHEYRKLPAGATVERRVGARASAKRGLIADFALFLVACAAFAAIGSLILAEAIPGARGFFLALALGAFLGAGIFRLPPRQAHIT
jgi:hypothetical protein